LNDPQFEKKCKFMVVNINNNHYYFNTDNENHSYLLNSSIEILELLINIQLCVTTVNIVRCRPPETGGGANYGKYARTCIAAFWELALNIQIS